MLRHSNIWHAIDRLARERGLSASGLARLGGLDPTTFNRSKRISRDGKPRWPSTESISKILDATGASLSEFLSYAGEGVGSGSFRNLPLIALDQVARPGFFDDFGHPIGEGWDAIPFPDLKDPQAYALEVSGDVLEPCYRDGDVLIVAPNAGPRRGDRVLVRTREGRVMAMVLQRRSARRIELRQLNDHSQEIVLFVDDVDWLARIVWASQ